MFGRISLWNHLNLMLFSKGCSWQLSPAIIHLFKRFLFGGGQFWQIIYFRVFLIAGRFFTSWATREALFTSILGSEIVYAEISHLLRFFNFILLVLTFKQCITLELWVKFYLEQSKDCSPGNNTSESFEKLLQRGRGNVRIYVTLVKGEHVFCRRLLLVTRGSYHHTEF